MTKRKGDTPTPLDRFLDVDFAVLQRVMDTGRCDMKFDTPNQAANTKLRLWRLRNSLIYYKPFDPLTQAVKTFMFKRQEERLSIIDRVRSAEYRVMQEAAAGLQSTDAISDPVEQEQRKSQDAVEELLKITQEFENGKD